MPFSGTGSGINDADDVFFSVLADNNLLKYDSGTAKWQNVDMAGFVTSTALANDSVTEPKLAVTNSPGSNQVLSWNGTGLEWTNPTATPADATSSTKGIVQLAGDLGGTATAPTVPGLAGKADTSHAHAISDVTGLQTAIDGKEATISAGTTAQYWRGDKSWQTLDKAAVGLTNVDNTSDANKPVSTATQTALDGKVDDTLSVSGADSITGGGALSTDRSLSLVGDAAAPGNNQYYGTNGTGTKGYHALPAGDPTMGGDLSGTASNAQLTAGSVDSTELANGSVTDTKLADDSVTEAKLAMSNSPSTGQVVSWNGSGLTWGATTAYSFTAVNISSATYTVGGPWEYVFADASATGITITLPTPALNSFVRVKRLNNAGSSVQVVAPGGSYIDASGVGSDVLSNPYESREYWSDGTNWFR